MSALRRSAQTRPPPRSRPAMLCVNAGAVADVLADDVLILGQGLTGHVFKVPTNQL
jgi:hypothetical protein